jgi:uncharacterized coiled-coil protein SlyX
MHDRLEQRLTELRSELAAGQKMSNELDAKRAELQATMLRIAGAIQVLEEVLQAEPAAEPPLARSMPPRPSNGAELLPG